MAAQEKSSAGIHARVPSASARPHTESPAHHFDRRPASRPRALAIPRGVSISFRITLAGTAGSASGVRRPRVSGSSATNCWVHHVRVMASTATNSLQ
jgi:hypothetical protein